MTNTILYGISAVLLTIAVPLANVIPIIYSRAPWHASLIGRAMMQQSVAFALIMDLVIVRLFLGDAYAGRQFVRVFVIALVLVSLINTTRALLWARRQHHPAMDTETNPVR